MRKRYDIVVIGGGHAGVEAANIAAKRGHGVALVTLDAAAIGRMSCNPAMGGLAKSQVIREVDCLGGLIGRCADLSAIQYRVLNRSKGAAVRATRSQNDRHGYPLAVQREIAKIDNIDVIEAEAAGIDVAGGRVSAVRTANGEAIPARAAIIASGTFLGGKIFTGKDSTAAGRLGEAPSVLLSQWLRAEGIKMLRFKTGTPPRIAASSVDYSRIEVQMGDDDYRPFSIHTKKEDSIGDQARCWITHTNEETCDTVRQNLALSPLFDGRIEGIGPRYCPSIEVKVVRFPNRTAHTIFIEPEGRDNPELYVNGLSMSLPPDLQLEILHSMRGLERCEVTQWAYAVEYDCIDPQQLERTLELRGIKGLYFAGQVNGTSGYEEAAGQGLWAGLNAALALEEREPFIMERRESYIAVMIDDLLTIGIDEPYRLFTSRAEYRLNLREDNVIWRMLPYAERFGLLPPERIERFHRLNEIYAAEKDRLSAERIPKSLGNMISNPNKPNGHNYLKLPRSSYADLVEAGYGDPNLPADVVERIEIETKYEGFLQRERSRASHNERLLSCIIPDELDFRSVDGLSAEAVEKLAQRRPRTLREASFIPGVTPAALFAIYIVLQKKGDVSRETFR